MTPETEKIPQRPSLFVNNIERLNHVPSPHLHSLTRSRIANLICNQNHLNRRPLGADAGRNGWRKRPLFPRGAGYPFPNSLQTAVRDQVHSKTRVRYPMVRKGFLASPESPRACAVRMSLCG
jgi:Neuraminidase (sialidase)